MNSNGLSFLESLVGVSRGGGGGAKEQCSEIIKLDETESAVTESRKGPEKTIQIC